MKEQAATESASASAPIDQRISDLGDWRERNACPHACTHSRGRCQRGRDVEVDGYAGVGARRRHLHGRNVQGQSEAHVPKRRVCR